MEVQRKAQLSDYRVTFQPESGQAVLHDLSTAMWVHDSTYQPGIDALSLAYREGQRSVIVQLLRTVEEALTLPDEVQESYKTLEQP